MSTQTPTPTRRDWTEILDSQRQNVSYVLIGVAGALVVAAAILMWKYGWDTASLIVGFLLFGLTALGCGLWFLGGTTGGLSGRDSARLLGLIVGGVLGLALAVGGIWQTLSWWHYIVGSGTEAEEAASPWRTWIVVGVVLAGLAVMFFSLLLARSEETDHANLRRLLYGYVAVLTGLLLAAILVGLNILSYFYLPKSSDWTEAGIYTLSSKSEQTLKNLKQPVKVYVMEQQRGDRFDVDMRDLMENARAVTDKIQAEYLIRDINVNEMDRLKQRYKPDDDLGLIVVYGAGDDAPHTFIPVRDVLPPPPFDPTGRGRQREPSFKGEDRLTSAIQTLEANKQKAVIYFTQGNGELDLFGQVPGARPAQRGQALLDRLQQRGNYEVKGLMLAVEGPANAADQRIVVSKDVPADADVVIVAGPTKPLAQGTIDALKKYMSVPRKEKDPLDEKKERERKGKLMVLAGVVAGENDKMAPLGLDRLLADYEVDVTNERVLRATREPRPERVLVTPNPDLKGKNPLATLFEGFGVQMSDVRVIRPRSGGARPGEAPKFQASELLTTAHPIFQQSYVFAETDLRPAADLLADYFATAARRTELQKKLTTSLPVGVAVAEPGAPDQNDPHAFMRGGRGEGAPRLVVIGDTAFASNEAIGGRSGREEGASVNYDLFASALAWLREKPGSMGIEPKDRGSYTMKQTTNLRAMLLFPLGLMSFAVIGLGLGVWVVRRLNFTQR
jgi:hypothetical protein